MEDFQSFASWGRVGEGWEFFGYWCSQFIPYGSQHIPNLCPRHLPIAPRFVPYHAPHD
jgi:hypothetical protein